MLQGPKNNKLVELKAKFEVARNIKNIPLCRVLSEAVEKQSDSDASLSINDFDAVVSLDAEVTHTLPCSPSVALSPLSTLIPGCCTRGRRSCLDITSNTLGQYWLFYFPNVTC